jgi:hypothetical protein
MAHPSHPTQALPAVFEAQRLIREPRPLPPNRVSLLRAHSKPTYPCGADALREQPLLQERLPDEALDAYHACAECCRPHGYFGHMCCEVIS